MSVVGRLRRFAAVKLLALLFLAAALLAAGFISARQERVSGVAAEQLAASSYRHGWQAGYRQERFAGYQNGYQSGRERGQQAGAKQAQQRLTSEQQAAKRARQAALQRQRQAERRRALAEQRAAALSISSAAGVSRATVQFISEFEGLCSTPCNDPVGYATIGHGHLIAYRPVNASDRQRIWVAGQQTPGRLTDDEAAELLRQDLGEFQQEVIKRLPGVPLTAEMITALVSFAFNLGPGYLDARPSNGYTRATNISARLRAGQYLAAARQMRIYDGAISGGKRIVFPGLTRRRNDEYQLMLAGIAKLQGRRGP